MSQGEEGEVGERLEVGGERGTVCWSFLHNSYSCLAKKFALLKLKPSRLFAQESELNRSYQIKI